jgi:signal transduction histidine kinase
LENQKPQPPELHSGLRKTFSKALVLQAVAITCGTILGIYAASAVLEDVLIKQALTREAEHFAKLVAQDSSVPPPNVYNMQGYLRARSGENRLEIPSEFRDLEPGFHSPRINGSRPLVFVEDIPQGRLFLKFDQQQVGRLALMFGIIPLVFVLLLVYVSTLIAYRLSKRALSPLLWLTNVVRNWDPKRPDPEALSPARLPEDLEGESQVLGDALYTYSLRIKELIERERNFTRDASHELRSPLTVIRIAADILIEEGELDAFSLKNAQRIKQSARDMESLIEAFLLLARDEESGVPHEDVLINTLVREEMERAEPLLAGKAVSLHYQQSCELMIRAPAKVLSVMLGNLIRNACSYTEKGSVTVRVESDRVLVEDTGVGMTEEDANRAFQAFFRAQGSSSRSGYGVGLAIVRRLSERFGWPVQLKSELGKGTKVTICFPNASANSTKEDQ